MSLTTLLGLDKVADTSVKDALGQMTMTDMLGALEGFANLQVDKITVFLKPTLEKAVAVLDEARGTLQRINTLLDRVGGKA